jgi:peptidoglycan/LPS O-acetylase OafA/YrhL
VPVAYLAIAPDGLHDTWVSSWGTWMALLSVHPLVHLPEFLIGMMAGRVFVLHPARHGSLLASTSLCCLLAALAWHPHLPYPLLKDGVLDPLMATLFIGVASSRGTFTRVLSSRPLVALGEASYAIYILHYPLFEWFCRLLNVSYSTALQSPPTFAVYLSVTIAVALLSGQLIETPARIAIRRRFARTSQPLVATPAASLTTM